MIQGYPDDASAFPGDIITFHVVTDAPLFRIEFYRQGATLELKRTTDPMDGVFADDHDSDQDWGVAATRRDGKQVAAWPPFPVNIPGDWQTGVYIAMFVECDANGDPDPNQQPPIDRTTADARTGKALFVVKNPAPGVASQVLYKVPLLTYQAYNATGGVSGYQTYTDENGQLQVYWVTFHRPGGGTGGIPWDVIPELMNLNPPNLDRMDDKSLRQTFVHWDTKFIVWLEAQGYRIDYCTDLDVHFDGNLSMLSCYALLVSIGHDEYYTPEMRDHVESFIANGGNVAFFSGNTSYGRIIFPDAFRLQRQFQWTDKPSDAWPNAPDRPEDFMTGVGFRNGGERNWPLPQAVSDFVGYTVQHTELWPFEDVGLKDGDVFAKDECIVGYECDGAPFDKSKAPPYVPSFNQEDETPAGLVILGTGDTSVWGAAGNQAATMAMYTRSGTVFTAATTDWARVVWLGERYSVQITRNVMDRLGGNPKGLAGLGNVANLISCDGFFSADDNFRHAVVATGDGNINEFPYSPVVGQPQGMSTFLNGVIDIGGFTSDDDRFRHIVALDFQNNVWDIAWGNNNQPIARILVNIPNAIRVAGFYTADDQFRHAIVGTSDGNVIEVYYAGIANANPQTALLGSFTNLADVGGFFSPDDGYRHAMVGTADGTITEIFYNPDFGIFQTPVATVPDLARVSGYHADGDQFYNRRVQVLTNEGRVHEVRYHPDFGIMRVVLYNPGLLVDLGGFYTGDDDYRHAIFATPDGDVQELFFTP